MYYRKTMFQNLEKSPIIDPVGRYDIPRIEPVDFSGAEFIGFNFAKSEKNKADKGIHFYLDDYQFERVWKSPEIYLKLLQQFKYVMSPDFSLFSDYPKALQIYNHYRKHWLAAYWQANGITVIPTICWSDVESFKFCFDGEPTGSVVSVSTIGVQTCARKKQAFTTGYNEMVKRLRPTKIIFYGNVPEECHGNIIRIKAFTEKWHEAITEEF